MLLHRTGHGDWKCEDRLVQGGLTVQRPRKEGCLLLRGTSVPGLVPEPGNRMPGCHRPQPFGCSP